MKKENRKMAQERRSIEREKAAKKKKTKKILSYAIPAVIVIILAAVIIIDAVRNSSATEDTETSTTTEETTDTTESTEDASESTTTENAEETASYSTDTTLTVADGDTVNIDYVGSIDGVEFDGGSTNGAGADLEIGSGTYIDDFEDQLIGSHPGDEVDVTVTFPDNYAVSDLAGKEALFEVTVNGIYED